MRKRLLLLMILASLAGQAGAQVLSTEVWLGTLDRTGGAFTVGALQNISNHPGYDNQPAFFPDGASLLFSSEAENLNDNGLGLHAMRYWIATGRTTALKKARGFSPTPTPDGKHFMTLREGTVWLHDLNGQPLRTLLPHVKTAGYYTRIDDRRWVLFMNEKDREIAIWDDAKGELTRVVSAANTAPYRIPGTNAVSFVVGEGTTTKLMRLDLDDAGNATTKDLAVIPFKTGGQHVWTSRGTLLIASGNEIREWSPSRPDDWPVVYRTDHAGLQGITRIALSPAEDRIAIVSTADDATVLRESRDAANKAFASAVAAHRTNAWVRLPDAFDITGDHATERGTSIQRWRSEGRPVELRTPYEATWKRVVQDNGTPAWLPESEHYGSH